MGIGPGQGSVCALLACLLGALLTGEALAGDKGAPRYDWTGLYLGGSVAITALDVHNETNGVSVGSDTSSGFGGGILGGFLRDVGRGRVIGVEADMTWDERSTRIAGDTFDLTHWGTVRGRAGYAVAPNALAFLSLGAAYADTDFVDNEAFGRGKGSDHVWGVAAGAGVEFASERGFRVRTEYLFAYFPDWNFSSMQGAAFAGNRHSVDLETHVFRLAGVLSLAGLMPRRWSK